MNNKLLTGVGLITALVLLLAVNMFSSVSFTSARLDLTERQAYTLSEGTLNILGKLDASEILPVDVFIKSAPAAIASIDA